MTISAADIEIVEGQTVYVPAYSHINILASGRTYPLSVTLSIRNTDANHPISIEFVKYFDSSGAIVERFVTEPRSLSPMASTEFFIEQRDARGGGGANFLVRWSAEGPVYEPVIEAVMVGTTGTLGVSFVSKGRVYGKPVGEGSAP
jgi:hypothetical protein